MRIVKITRRENELLAALCDLTLSTRDIATRMDYFDVGSVYAMSTLLYKKVGIRGRERLARERHLIEVKIVARSNRTKVEIENAALKRALLAALNALDSRRTAEDSGA